MTVRHKGKEYKFSLSAKMLYSYLGGFEKAFPSLSAIAEYLGLTRDAAKIATAKLEEMGLVVKETRYGQSNVYSIVVPEITEDGKTAIIS
jgi:DNA-binding MarR family transcriptional regulator